MGQFHWFRPGAAEDYRVCNPFTLYVKKGNKTFTKFLQAKGPDKRPAIKDIEFEEKIPVAILKYKDKDLPVKLALSVFSPFIKKNAKNSGLSAAIDGANMPPLA